MLPDIATISRCRGDRNLNSLAVVLLSFVFHFACQPSAIAGPPAVTWLHPSGAARGSTVTVAAGGTFTTWPVNTAMTPSQGVVIKPEKDKGKFTIEVDAKAEPGLRWIRLYNSEGASTVRPFLIGVLPEINEKETNDIEPQVIQGPVVVNGKLGKRGDVDVYRVALKKGQTLVASLDANRALGSPIDASLQLCDDRRFILQEVDDTCGLDPRIVHTATKDADVLVRAFAFPSQPSSSISFTGGETHLYRLTLTTDGFINHAFPVAVSQSQDSKVDLHGWNLPADTSQLLKQPIAANQLVYLTHPAAGNVAAVQSTDLPVFRAGQMPKGASSPPFMVSGKIDKPGHVAKFRFNASKGKSVRLGVASRSLGFPLDAVLSVADTSGKVLSEKDDVGRDVRDPRLDFKPPADGEYVVSVRDLQGRGGFRFVYRLDVVPIKPDFELTTAKDSLVVPAGKQAELEIKVARTSGFKEAITMTLEGLPKTVVVKPVVSEAKGATAKAAKLIVHSKDVAWSGPVRIIGKSASNIKRTASYATVVPSQTRQQVWLTIQAAGK